MSSIWTGQHFYLFLWFVGQESAFNSAADLPAEVVTSFSVWLRLCLSRIYAFRLLPEIEVQADLMLNTIKHCGGISLRRYVRLRQSLSRTGQLKINYSIKQETNYKIYISNLNGNIVHQIYNGNLPNGEYNLTYDAKSLANGIYILNFISDSGKNIHEKIILQR
ncbi:MAG: T9SS type A sorting domain-containing protein [Bacteroidetes bacterium]|nr:T9SS type A sorting domain-containing protein [Bacteroidota bacterium]